MNVYLDNIIFELQNAGGISVYWYELLKRMLQEDIDLKIIERSEGKKNIFRKRLEIDDKYICKDKALPLLIRRYCDVKVRSKAASVFHSSYYRTAKAKAAVNITTVYDFTYEYFRTGFPKAVHSWQKKRAIVNSDGIICISESTKRDLMKIYPKIDSEKIKVIYLAAGEEFYPFKKGIHLDLNSQLANILDEKYILYLGSRSKYKKFKMAVEIVSMLGRFKLVIVGGKRLSRDELRYLDEKLSGKFVYFDKISSEKLNYLFNFAFCLLYPSKYEGFGIPILEAMQAGCPVVTTNASSIPEVCGSAALMVEHISSDKFINEINKLEDNDIQKKTKEQGFQQAKRFSWERTHKETMTFYEKIYENKMRR